MANETRPRVRYGEAFWRAHHEAWQQSALNQREYCEAHGIGDVAMACDALTAVARCFVLSLDSEQVVTKKAVRLHCHSAPRSGSDTTCGRPTATAAPAATIATAAIASVLDLCQMNLMAFSDLRGLKSALCRHDSMRASSPLRNRTTGTSLRRTSTPLAPVTMSDSALAGFSRRRLQHDRRIEDHQVAAASPQR